MSSSRWPAALILGRVVEQRRDRLVLAAAVLEHERGDAEQVRAMYGTPDPLRTWSAWTTAA